MPGPAPETKIPKTPPPVEILGASEEPLPDDGGIPPHHPDDEIALDPNSRGWNGRQVSIGEQIQRDARERGFGDDISGLTLEMEGGRRYVVNESYLQHEQITRTRMTMLPHFREGERMPRRREIETTMYRKQGAPRLVTRSKEGSIERPDVEIGKKEVPYVDVEIYDELGDLTKIESMRREDFYASFAGQDGLEVAHWGGRRWGEHRETDNLEDLRLTLTGKRPAFKEIQDQLDENGISNWTGLGLTRRRPRNHRPKHHRGERRRDSAEGIWSTRGDTPESLHVVGVTEEVVADKAVKEHAYKVGDLKWSRFLTVRTTKEFDDGTVETTEDTIRDYEFWQALEDPQDGLSVIEDVHITSPDVPSGETAAVTPGQRQEWVDAPAGPDSPSLADALGMLSYPEKHLVEHGDEKGKAIIDALVGKLEKTEEKQYAEELQRTVSEMGREDFYGVVDEVHTNYLRSMDRLGLERSDWDISQSWIIRELVKKRLENRAENDRPALDGDLWDPFSQSLEARKFRRDMVDSRIGKRANEAAVNLSPPIPVPTGEIDEKTGKPGVEMRRQLDEFPRSMFDRIMPFASGDGGRGAYGMTMGEKKWRDGIWAPIEALNKRSFDELRRARMAEQRLVEKTGDKRARVELSDEMKEAREERFRVVGRMLRATIGE